MLVAQVELDGVWSVKGGMHAVALALARLAERKGVQFQYGVACKEVLVRSGQACGVLLANGEHIAADSVIFNGDVGALSSGLLGHESQSAVPGAPANKRSLSALTWSMHTHTSGFPLVRHNVFFDTDYASEFEDIFHGHRLPGMGTVYVCAQDRNDDAMAPGKPERLLCLVNAPATGDTNPFDASETQPCETRSLALLRHCGLILQPQPHQSVLTTPHTSTNYSRARGERFMGGRLTAGCQHSSALHR